MPNTNAGKSVSAQNAVTHGLTARQTVLTAHGEDPADYEALRGEISEALRPRNSLERHYVETIAAATWRLARFRRWQSRLYADGDLTEDERLAQIERAIRHETALHRQIDRALRALACTLPDLLASRSLPDAPTSPEATPAPCSPIPSQTDATPQNCKNELQNCKNELPRNPPASRIRPSDLWGLQTILPSERPQPLSGNGLARQARQLALTAGRTKNVKTNSRLPNASLTDVL